MSILLQRYDFLIQTLYRITTIIINLSLSYKPRHTISSKLQRLFPSQKNASAFDLKRKDV